MVQCIIFPLWRHLMWIKLDNIEFNGRSLSISCAPNAIQIIFKTNDIHLLGPFLLANRSIVFQYRFEFKLFVCVLDQFDQFDSALANNGHAPRQIETSISASTDNKNQKKKISLKKHMHVETITIHTKIKLMKHLDSAGNGGKSEFPPKLL